jgi:hypothetical protein
MSETERVINDLNVAKRMLCNPQMLTPEMCIKIGQAITNAIALLKEQEPVEPIPPIDESDLWKCGNCNHQLFRCTHQRYCEMCGRSVKWE